MELKSYLLFRGIRLIDGVSSDVISDAVFLCGAGDKTEEEEILYCGTAGEFDESRIPANTKVFDLSGKTYTMLPGLINTHVHLSLDLPYLPYYADPFGDPYRAMVSYRRACEALMVGVTTVRGVGNSGASEVAVRNAINSGMFAGPRIITCGTALCPHGGHGSTGVDCVECSGVDEFIRNLRRQLSIGVDQIKLMYTGGLAGAYEGALDIQMTEEEVASCIKVAHNNSRKISAHLSNDRAIAQAVMLGMDGVEHAYTLSDETCKMMAEKGTFLTPTLAVSHCNDYLKKNGVQEYHLKKQEKAAAEHIASCKRAAKAGVTICTGTDMLPSDPIEGTFATTREIELLVEEVGMSPLQAIRCGTYHGAMLCGIEKQTGSLKTGKSGDFILVEGKPDENIRDLRKLRLVAKGSRMVVSSVPGYEKQSFQPLFDGMSCDGGVFRKW